MQITVTLDNCSHCRHRDHSGSFTPGGAKQICGYPNVSKWVLKTNKNTRNDNANGNLSESQLNKQCYYWKNRIVENHLKDKESFPVFCPLKHGEHY